MHGFLGTRGTLLSDINLILELVIIGVVAVGWRLGRKHRGGRHHWTMLATFAVFLAFFAVYSLHRSIDPAVSPVHDTVYFAVYLPVVIVHSLVSTLVLALGAWVSLQALRHARRRTHALEPGFRGRHVRLGVLSMWCYLLSAVTGIAVYVLLYVR